MRVRVGRSDTSLALGRCEMGMQVGSSSMWKASKCGKLKIGTFELSWESEHTSQHSMA